MRPLSLIHDRKMTGEKRKMVPPGTHCDGTRLATGGTGRGPLSAPGLGRAGARRAGRHRTGPRWGREHAARRGARGGPGTGSAVGSPPSPGLHRLRLAGRLILCARSPVGRTSGWSGPDSGTPDADFFPRVRARETERRRPRRVGVFCGCASAMLLRLLQRLQQHLNHRFRHGTLRLQMSPHPRLAGKKARILCPHRRSQPCNGFCLVIQPFGLCEERVGLFVGIGAGIQPPARGSLLALFVPA